jgi:hypothetical protein
LASQSVIASPENSLRILKTRAGDFFRVEGSRLRFAAANRTAHRPCEAAPSKTASVSPDQPVNRLDPSGMQDESWEQRAYGTGKTTAPMPPPPAYPSDWGSWEALNWADATGQAPGAASASGSPYVPGLSGLPFQQVQRIQEMVRGGYPDTNGRFGDVTNEDRMRVAAYNNGVPQELINAIIKTINEVSVFPIGLNPCERWTDEFLKLFEKRAMTNVNTPNISAKLASQVGLGASPFGAPLLALSPSTKRYDYVTMYQQRWDLLYMPPIFPNHSVIYVRFEDGTEFFIDNGWWGDSSHIATQVPCTGPKAGKLGSTEWGLGTRFSDFIWPKKKQFTFHPDWPR